MLNTVITLTIYDSKDETLLDKAFEVCKEYENALSKTIETSEIYTFNNRTAEQSTFTLSDKSREVIEKGLYYSNLSKGAFDITIAPLSSLWNFTSETPSIPLASDIQQATQYVDYKNVSLKDHQITFASPHTQLDLGAIAKGYIADQLKTYLTQQGIKSAVINLGGNILCIGNKPDGTPFKIGIQKPFEDRNETIGIMNIEDMSVVSSGVYERNFIVDGVNYHHILNPKTGYSYNNGLISVTIISKQSVDGDGLSTTCFALGLEEGLKLINSTVDTYAIFITDDYKIHYSKGAEALLK
jgi:thiamine biosynthesis lipoprotein